jgi:hypothetical protein
MSSSHAGDARRLDGGHVPPAPESSTRRRAPANRDAHFLSRLDRLTSDHIELALSIYRDAQLVRMIFELAHLQDVKRVAISLGHPNQGPFVVVMNRGHFVTCLGEGMSAWPLPIISRKQLLQMRARLKASRRARLARK